VRALEAVPKGLHYSGRERVDANEEVEKANTGNQILGAARSPPGPRDWPATGHVIEGIAF